MYIDDGLDGNFTVGYDGGKNPSKVFTTIYGLNSMTIYRLKAVATNKAGVGLTSNLITCYTVTIPN